MSERAHIVIAPEGKLAMGGEWVEVDPRAFDRPLTETLHGLSIEQVVQLLNRRPLGRLSRLEQVTSDYGAVFVARPPHNIQPTASYLVTYLEMIKPERRGLNDPILTKISLSATRQVSPDTFRTVQFVWLPINKGRFNLANAGASPEHGQPYLTKDTVQSDFEPIRGVQNDEEIEDGKPAFADFVLDGAGVLRVPQQVQLPGQEGVDNWT